MTGSASAPASSGNLGPGFDCLALAYELRCTVEAEPASTWLLEEQGATGPLPEDDMIRRAAEPVAAGPLHLRIDNQVPRSRGLGSSSAVTTAAAAAAMRARGDEIDRRRVFEVVAALEGHDDNAAAAVYGGLVLAGEGRVRHLDMDPSLRVVVAIPDYPLRTSEAREALPAEVDRPVVVRSLARLGQLLEGLRTGDADALAAASGDELHEQPRAHLSPLTGELMDAARSAGALHACWSGAGPTAMALVTVDELEAVIAALAACIGDQGTVRSLDVANDGVI